MIGKSVILQIVLKEMKLSDVLKCLGTCVEYNMSQGVLQTYYTNYLFLVLINLLSLILIPTKMHIHVIGYFLKC